MTALSVVRDASLSIGIARPSQLFAGTTRELLELQALLNEVAKMIAFDSGRDWTALKTLHTIEGDGTATSFALPSDYKRMLKQVSLWTSTMPGSPLTHVPDSDAWLGLGAQNFLHGSWTLIGDEIHIRMNGNSAYTSGATAQFYYLTRNIVRGEDGSLKAEFTADDDRFRLDERLLKLALIYRWKQEKGQDYSEALADYENALAQAIGADKGSSVLTSGGRHGHFDAGYAYPWPLGQ